MNVCDAITNAKTTKIHWLANQLIDITGEERLSITFRIGKDDITRKDKHMSITFRIGKDDITRKLNTCYL